MWWRWPEDIEVDGECGGGGLKIWKWTESVVEMARRYGSGRRVWWRWSEDMEVDGECDGDGLKIWKWTESVVEVT